MDFSIIIPAKNEEANIGRCLDSIFAVDADPARYEVIVVDNGSSDRTVELARAKGAIVHAQPGLTISGLRNFGAAQARGEILAFMDADCSVAADWLASASCYLSRPEVVCFGSPPGVPAEATWVQSAWFQVRRKREPVGETEWLESMNLFVRREAFLAAGGFDESLVTCEDYDLSVRLKRKGALLNDTRIAAIHHGEAATVGHFFRKELWRGRSNLRGIWQHGIVLRELPSLFAPLLHTILFLAVTVLLCYRDRWRWLPGFLLTLGAWQCFLLVKSWRTQRSAPSLSRVVQLYWLLNVYLFARGAAALRVR